MLSSGVHVAFLWDLIEVEKLIIQSPLTASFEGEGRELPLSIWYGRTVDGRRAEMEKHTRIRAMLV